MKKSFLFCLFYCFLSATAIAQEICNDGIDNDGDGFIDCFDGDCADSQACDGFYMANDASCLATPAEFPQFSLELDYQSQNNVTLNLSRIAVGDLDRDGIPEILSTNRYNDAIYLLNGSDATIKYQATTNNPSFREASMANLEDDNCGEVFVINENWNTNYTITAFDCQLNQLWTSERMTQDPIALNFADFDHDGQAEMYYKNEIRDPVTGTVLYRDSTVNWNDIPGSVVAVDILGDETLELVIGNEIYSVNLGDRSERSGSLTLLKTMPSPFQAKRGTYASAQGVSTSVVDYNQDGHLDVIIAGADTSNITTIYLWDIENNSVKTFSDTFGIDLYQFGWIRGAGRVNIADINGDGKLNATFISGRFLYALDENWEPLWTDEIGDPSPVRVNEETSGITSLTLFDFNGDGKAEIVYRDEDNLYFINGDNGSVNTSLPCRSRTGMENPLVVDVDNDGSTEICVVCASENYQPTTPGRNISLNSPAEVRIYRSANAPWVPSRSVWNQAGYFNVNINDDLTVPQYQQAHHLVFSENVCTDGPNRPLNGFLNQSAILTPDGCYANAAAELSMVDSSLKVDAYDCDTQEFSLAFQIVNKGDVTIEDPIYISLYNGNPATGTYARLNTVTRPITDFAPGDTLSISEVPVEAGSENFDLYVAINDNGSSAPNPIDFPTSTILECDYSNNIESILVNYQTIAHDLRLEVTQPNTNCVNTNGSITAYAKNQSSFYTYEWYEGDTVGIGDPIGNDSTLTGLDAGLYSLRLTDANNGCTSTATIEITDNTVTPVLEASVLDIRCSTENAGEISASVSGDTIGYQFNWYIGSELKTTADFTGSNITGLPAGMYTVQATNTESLCVSEPLTVQIHAYPAPEIVDYEIINNTACDSTLANGAIYLQLQNMNAANSIRWFEGVDTTGIQIAQGIEVTALQAGEYTVYIEDSVTKCTLMEVFSIGNSILQPALTVEVTDNSSCETYNGELVASLNGANKDNFDFFWYEGEALNDSTQLGNQNSVLSNLAAGIYTVQAVNRTTKCATNVVEVEIKNQGQIAASISNIVNDDRNQLGSGSISLLIENEEEAYEIYLNGELYQQSSSSTITIPNLAAGFYELEFKRISSGCSAIINFNIETIKNSETDILSFILPSQTGAAVIDTVNHTVTIEVADSSDLTILSPTVEVSAGAYLYPSTNIVLDFTETVRYTVTAEDSLSSQVWLIDVSKAPVLSNRLIANKFSLYPNPAKNMLKLSDYSGNASHMEIYSAEGKLIKMIPLGDIPEHSIDISNLRSGIYYIRLSATNSKILKIIKE